MSTENTTDPKGNGLVAPSSTPPTYWPIHKYTLMDEPGEKAIKILKKDNIPCMCHKVPMTSIPKTGIQIAGSDAAVQNIELQPTYCTTRCTRASICQGSDGSVVFRQTCEALGQQFILDGIKLEAAK